MTTQHKKTRIESDSMGEIPVPAEAYWVHKQNVLFIILLSAEIKCRKN